MSPGSLGNRDVGRPIGGVGTGSGLIGVQFEPVTIITSNSASHNLPPKQQGILYNSELS